MEPLHPGDPSAVGPYRLLGRLGAGGMGQVFLGRAPAGTLVAVKVVRGELAREPDFRRRFRTEVAASRRVGGTWTAPVLDFDTESPIPWVATGYVAGPPLREVVERHGPLAEHSVWALAYGLAGALTAVHGSGLIHRDLKPSNVMVTLEGPRVIDFGIARAVDASAITRTGAMVGSPGYMPPEQIKGEAVTGAADVFALGAVLAYAATGVSPFAWDGAHLHTVLYRVMHEPPQLGPPDGLLTGELRALVARCLSKQPGERPSPEAIVPAARRLAGTAFWLPPELTTRLRQNAAALRTLDETPPALPPVAPDRTTYVSGVSKPPPLPAYPPPAPASGRRRGRYALAAGAGALALAAAAWLVVANAGEGEAGPRADHRPTPTTGSGPADLRSVGVLTVHVADRHPPVLFLDEAGSDPAGFEVELAEEIGERLGVEVEFSDAGDDELAAGAAVTEGAESATHLAMADFTDSSETRAELGVDFVNHYANGWAVMSDAPGLSGDLSELCGTTVATYSDRDMVGRLQRLTEDCPEPVEVAGFGSRDEMAAAVREGEAEAAFLLYSQAAAYRADNPDSGMNVAFDRQYAGPRGIAVPSGQEALREAVFTTLTTLFEDGTYAALLDRWSIPEAALDTPDINAGG
ncbi:serine/threonine-protein kinase [Streptomyces sp. DSM 44917]|uniref:Serine/threonine-protein kinase n=1 Tax=Streptomyces boetiae TaxID=3075541 RepID=A0ABU2LFR3_9ACTN|nr:serine/threonine-protein kinase [Streptomyces sp. DSM 44917]MDT0310419.1 serine/threonine-protein kinase [Streptomyces sp. DSM 44917]